MKIRKDVAELLHAGLSDRQIAAQLHVCATEASAARRALRLPQARPGKKALSLEELFHARTRPVDGGHLEWTGHVTPHGCPTVRSDGRQYSAHRIAFRLRHGRDAIGNARPGCGHDGCVAPDHVEDRPMREQLRTQYDAIFGALS